MNGSFDEKKADTDVILKVSGLNAFYRDRDKAGIFSGSGARKQILKNVSFEIRSGEIVGLVGESGCGKSTLAKCILGIVKDHDGRIEHASTGAQMVFQDPYWKNHLG